MVPRGGGGRGPGSRSMNTEFQLERVLGTDGVMIAQHVRVINVAELHIHFVRCILP